MSIFHEQEVEQTRTNERRTMKADICLQNTDMKRFWTGPKRNQAVQKQLTVQKQTAIDSEARERADFNCLSGAGGPESILSVVEAPKPDNESMTALIFHWFNKVSCLRENALRKPSLGNAFQ